MIKRLLLTIIITVTTTAGYAQTAELETSRILDGKIVPMERMVATKVRGRSLSRYKLNYYRSARFECSTKEMETCLNTVRTDAAMAQSKTMTRRGDKRTNLFFMLQPNGKTNRFISYLHERQTKNRYKVTIIYMEGSVGSLEELEKLIDK